MSHNVGEANPKARLDWVRVELMRARHDAGATQSELVAEFGVSQATVSKVVNGQVWAR